jgi:hypothetical protein
MALAEHRPDLRQHFLQYICYLFHFSLLFVRHCQIAHDCEFVWMVLAQRHLGLPQNFFHHRCRLFHSSLLCVRHSQVAHDCDCVWMVLAQRHLGLTQNFLHHRCRLFHSSLLYVRHCQVAHGCGWMGLDQDRLKLPQHFPGQPYSIDFAYRAKFFVCSSTYPLLILFN